MIHTIQPDLFKPHRQPVPIRADRDSGDIAASRHRGAETSIAANKRVNKDIDRFKVLAVIRTRGNATLKEIAGELGREKNCISGRITELLADEIIWFVEGETRAGCRVYRIR